MAFDNSSIIPPRPLKPHVCFRDGYWRVSKCPSRYPRLEGVTYMDWNKSHDVVQALNRDGFGGEAARRMSNFKRGWAIPKQRQRSQTDRTHSRKRW